MPRPRGLDGGPADRLEPEPRSPDDWAFWAYTSGSTGPPKAVMHTQSTLIRGGRVFPDSVLNITADDVVFSVAKLFFTYGTGFNMYIPLAAGASAVLNPRRPTPEEMFRLLDQYRPTIFAGVPTMYAAMLQIADAEHRFRTDSLRMCWSGGEALPPRIYQEWRRRFGLEILEMLGSSEMIHAVCTTRPGMDRPGSIGVPVPGYEFRLVEEDLLDSAGRSARAAHDQGPHDLRRLLEPPGQESRDVPRRVDALGRHGAARRRGRVLVRGAHR